MKLLGWVTLLGKIVLFVTGVGIVIGQTGFPFLIASPEKLSIPALLTGALFCNGPVVLQALSIKFGVSPSGVSSPSSLPPSSSAPSSGAE